MRKIFSFILACLILSAVSPCRADILDDPQNFQKINPDGRKYEFVRDFLVSLQYLYQNSRRYTEKLPLDSETLSGGEKVNGLIKGLIADNVNLRAARNTMKKYLNENNRMIVKAVDLMAKLCDEQVEFNNQERKLFSDAKEIHETGKVEEFDRNGFIQAQNDLAVVRKDSLQKLLEAAFLVQKILLSAEPDESGRFTSLAVNRRERRQLLTQIDGFIGEGYEGRMREGQTFLQSSIAAIRETLENEDLRTRRTF